MMLTRMRADGAPMTVKELAQRGSANCEFVEALVTACFLATEEQEREDEYRAGRQMRQAVGDTSLIKVLLGCIDHFRVAIGDDLEAIEKEMLPAHGNEAGSGASDAGRGARVDRDGGALDRQPGDLA